MFRFGFDRAPHFVDAVLVESLDTLGAGDNIRLLRLSEERRSICGAARFIEIKWPLGPYQGRVIGRASAATTTSMQLQMLGHLSPSAPSGLKSNGAERVKDTQE